MQSKLYEFYIIHQQKYRESSLLLTIFTAEFGKLSVVARVNKKQASLYQPLNKLKAEIHFSKKDNGLNKIYNVEFVSADYKSSYIVLLSTQYINELIYLLLSHSHEEIQLFKKYDFIINTINIDNYFYLLRMFELEFLSSLGLAIATDVDIFGDTIVDSDTYQIIPFHGFKPIVSQQADVFVCGINIKKIYNSMLTWDNGDLKAISRITRVNINACLDGRQLKSRKLLLDYLNIKKLDNLRNNPCNFKENHN